jgi:hypothetical protein
MIEPRTDSRSLILITAVAALLGAGCASPSPRVTEVSARYLRSNKNPAADVVYQRGESKMNGGMVGQSARNAAGEEFLIRWTSPLVRSIKFDYRQVNRPDKELQASAVATNSNWHVFTIAGDDFKEGGPVSAWRVSLLDETGECLATKQSVMW